MPDPGAAVLQPGSVFHGRYRVVRCVKAGGMGAVHEVNDKNTGSFRALKVMLPSTLEDPELRARFAREAQIIGALQSDHIVRISDAGMDESTGLPFLVMDLLRGDELGSVMERQGALPGEEVVVYLFQVALALDRMHAAGVVHRDLKPENLLVTRRDDGSPCVKILDFGIAKVLAEGDPAATTKALGTPLYMSPEQIRGEGAIGPRTDVYALGHIAYALLAGEPYWCEEKKRHPSTYPLLSRILLGVSELPSARAARRSGVSLPQPFDEWFLTATAILPDDRFHGAGAAVAALAAALDVPLPKPPFRTRDDIARPAGGGESQGESTDTASAVDPRARPRSHSGLRVPLAAAALGAVVVAAVVSLRAGSPTVSEGGKSAAAAAPSASVDRPHSEPPGPAADAPAPRAAAIAAPRVTATTVGRAGPQKTARPAPVPASNPSRSGIPAPPVTRPKYEGIY